MRKIPLKYQTRLNHLYLLHYKMLNKYRIYRNYSSYEYYKIKEQKLFSKIMIILLRYEHTCLCGKIIPLLNNKCSICRIDNFEL